MYQRFFKRFLDVILASAILVIGSPFFIAVGLAVKLTSPGPISFRQNRVGKDKKVFKIWKYRTMRLDAPRDVPTHLLPEPERYITPVGRFLRASSIDELPQLLNVVAGHMSLIGPRPALWNQDDLVVLRDQYGANCVRPGLSGWAQVNGRDELSLEKKALRDGEYAQNVSFRLDVKCFLLTLMKVFNREGIAEGREGMHYQTRRLEDEP